MTDDWTYCGRCKRNMRTQVRKPDGTVTPVCVACDFPERLPAVPGSQVNAVETPD